MAENTMLLNRLEGEKVGLSKDIATLRERVALAEKLVSVNRLPAEIYQEFMSVSSSLDSLVLKPALTFRQPASASFSKDLTAKLNALENNLDELQTDVLDLSQKRTSLAVEEQKLNAKRSSFLQEIAFTQTQCDNLLIQKEKLESEVRELEALHEFWQERNSQSESALQSAMDQLSSFQREKDAKSVHLLEDLENLYVILDEASEILQSQVSGK
jgi:chromosome segregation ATPase